MAELAMARNPIIYGLADEIYVAESSDKGGTWSGVKDGLRKGRKIYVRNPEINEVNANHLLLNLGAIPVDINGNILEHTASANLTDDADNIQDKIIAVLANKTLTAKEICESIDSTWTPRIMTDYLKTLDNIELVKQGKANKYKIKSDLDSQLSIF